MSYGINYDLVSLSGKVTEGNLSVPFDENKKGLSLHFYKPHREKIIEKSVMSEFIFEKLDFMRLAECLLKEAQKQNLEVSDEEAVFVTSVDVTSLAGTIAKWVKNRDLKYWVVERDEIIAATLRINNEESK